VGVMIDRLEAQGHWDLELPVSRLLTKEWGSAVSMRSDYLNRASTIRLEDIAL
jgi:membrane protein